MTEFTWRKWPFSKADSGTVSLAFLPQTPPFSDFTPKISRVFPNPELTNLPLLSVLNFVVCPETKQERQAINEVQKERKKNIGIYTKYGEILVAFSLPFEWFPGKQTSFIILRAAWKPHKWHPIGDNWAGGCVWKLGQGVQKIQRAGGK